MKTLLLAAGMLFSAPAVQADECYAARWPNAEVTVIAVVNGEHFAGTYDDKVEAVLHAQNLGLCVRDYGVYNEQVDPTTMEAEKWEKREGFSVWR